MSRLQLYCLCKKSSAVARVRVCRVGLKKPDRQAKDLPQAYASAYESFPFVGRRASLVQPFHGDRTRPATHWLAVVVITLTAADVTSGSRRSARRRGFGIWRPRRHHH
jgi:hypothetical protein